MPSSAGESGAVLSWEEGWTQEGKMGEQNVNLKDGSMEAVSRYLQGILGGAFAQKKFINLI